jgi:hypothetical protein
MHVNLQLRILLHQRTGSARMIQVNVREKKRMKIANAQTVSS